MPVNERFEDPGSFTVTLNETLADVSEVLESIVEFGHIVILPQWVQHPDQFADSDLLGEARYAGVVLETDWSGGGPQIHGAGMVWHLASRDTSTIIETKTSFSAAVLSTVLALKSGGGILPPAVPPGTITDTGLNTFTGIFYPGQTCLEAVRTVMTDLGAHFRVNPVGTLDACATSRDEVYTVTSPTVVAVRVGGGTDPTYVGIETRGNMRTRRDASRWASDATETYDLPDGTPTVGDSVARGSNPYFDLHGNALERRILARAAGDSYGSFRQDFFTNLLNEWDTFDTQEIDTSQWEFIGGGFEVGDYVYAFDPPSGFVDTANEVFFRGSMIWPKKVRVTEYEWDLAEGMGVYYRPGGAAVTSADWIDLSRYVKWEATA